MAITSASFGQTNAGQEVKSYRLTNPSGAYCILLDYGATIQALALPDREGQLRDLVLGYDDMAGYESDFNAYQGALVGRHGNRIEDAQFEIDGITYKLAANDGCNHLHGGIKNFSKQVWQTELLDSDTDPAVKFSLVSPDMDEGYPGQLKASVTYTLTADNELKLEYEAVSDKKTVINLTNHAYFNLQGHGAGSILDEQIMIAADSFTTINDECIPDGSLTDVEGTALDLRQPVRIGDRIDQEDPALLAGKGFDHNFVIRDYDGSLKLCATAHNDSSGIKMEVYSSLPGIQFYSGNFLKKHPAKEGAVYDYRSGFCLETQFFPNSLKHKHFPSPVFDAGQPFKHTTIYKFTVL